MGFMRDVEIIWDDLLDAFQNDDLETMYFLDRETGEIFFVPVDYEDDDFWDELELNSDRYLQIPGFDYEQERLLLNELIKGVTSDSLKNLLVRSLTGKYSYGRLDEILSFYPEEKERLTALKEELIADRIRNWLEVNDIFLSDNTR
ncbi:MAG TPA: UPF0158 family protein [Geobacteraceae bacterium]|jgi:hypothetical protein|nr:UPF0158 family protein [Geobacteraceae bacterium]